MKINENIAAALITEHAIDTPTTVVVEQTPVWRPVHAYTGYSSMFEGNVTVIVFEHTKSDKYSCQPFANGQSLGNPFVCTSKQQALNEARKAFSHGRSNNA